MQRPGGGVATRGSLRSGLASRSRPSWTVRQPQGWTPWEEESFVLSCSTSSDADFDAVVGYLEDITTDDKFQLLQRNFVGKYYREFEDMEENKLTYTPNFKECISLVEKYIEEQLLEQISGFKMEAFTATLQHHKDEVAGDIFDMLLTFMDFLAFKEMFQDYRAEKEGGELELISGLVMISLCKSSSLPPSQNNLRYLVPATEWDHSRCHWPKKPIGSPNDDRKIHLGKTDSVLCAYYRWVKTKMT
ncbi:ADP-ribosylation factor-like protein 2-binding protein [Lemur catta]|uniref:ADP-ribosylation factor-like protein 2-binding protein n=1 Tax=Lemur catta TaxID=9447 RepID=UPI001E26C684|nr:ADP-ribosylation factor-like protein 2-binding protein [Lemur catta]